MTDFTDRFLVATPTLVGVDISTLTDVQLEALSGSVKEFVEMVRFYSALIKKKGAVEIYQICTQQVDPRIALILAAARDGAGIRIFPDLTTVKQVMFGQIDPTQSAYVNPELNIFTQGVKRIAAALTASILIGQLAQIEEQAKHSIVLEENALKDLQRLLAVPDVAAVAEVGAAGEDETKSFYFQPFSLTLGNRILKAEYFMASAASSSWQMVNNYTGHFSTAELVADLADAINSYTLVQQTTNIIAAPILGDDSTFYKIEFKARQRDANIACEIISVRFRYLDAPSDPLPFRWGVSPAGLNDQFINSLLLAVQQGKATTVGVTSTDRSGDPTVLYFKRAPVNDSNEVLDYLGNPISSALWATQGTLTFRISPTMIENASVSIPYQTNANPDQQAMLDALRPSQVAELLLDQLFALKGDTLALGALVRNDYPDSTNALVAVELIAFSVTNPQCWLILDLLALPPDVVVATGNLKGPLTPFSSKPRSIRVESKFYAAVAQQLQTSTKEVRVAPRVVKAPISERLQFVRDQSTYRVTERYRGEPYPPYQRPND